MLARLAGGTFADPGAIVKFVVSAAFNDPDHLLELAACAEECGFEAMAFPDHVVHPEKLDTPYPYTADGSRRWSAFTPWVDPWVAIGACAAVTTRLRFTNNVFVLAMRNPLRRRSPPQRCCRAGA
jgi:alkanesulfonate monooxygenase SsuD/methylene tetrahydromethanopterin reductase-like flavin-dependent oxidoreductase (luciferase family)